MEDHPFELTVITKGVLKMAITLASRRLVYCAPGVDEDIASALAEATERLPSAYIHIDTSERSLWAGYGTPKGVEILAELRKARIAETWRLGLLIADDEAFIYAPTAESQEPPPFGSEMPNGMILRGSVVEQLLDDTRGENTLPILVPKELPAQPETTNAEASHPVEVAKVASASHIPAPKDARMMNMVRRLFKLVRFHHSLTLADKKVRLTAKDFGFRTQGIDPQLSISFNVVSDEHRKAIKRILSGVEREVEKFVKGGLIQSLPPHGYVIWYADPQEFETTFAKVKTIIEAQIKEWFDNNYSKVQDDSKSLVQKFLNDDLFDRINPTREPRHRRLSDSEFRSQWVQKQSQKFELPPADEVKKTLKVRYVVSDISQQMIEDKEFRSSLEAAFGINLEELLEREDRRSSMAGNQ